MEFFDVTSERAKQPSLSICTLRNDFEGGRSGSANSIFGRKSTKKGAVGLYTKPTCFSGWRLKGWTIVVDAT